MRELRQTEYQNINMLKKLLEDNGIDISQWGKGAAKTIEHLQKEIVEQETFLIIGETGELIRKVVIVGADIYYTSQDGKRYRLKEDRQVFNDGSERRRDYGHAVSEKMKIEEEPEIAMIRGIREELGIEGVIQLSKTEADEKVISSPSYPGLNSHYIRYGFEVFLSENQFNIEGYVEEQADKKTYFVWEQINSNN